MNILIVGGSGFIGRNVVEYVARSASRARIYSTYRNDTTFPQFARQWDVEPIQIDLLDVEAIRELPNCELCLFVAGNSNHSVSAHEALTDVTSLINFLNHFRGKLVFLSSGALYYGLQGSLSETVAVSPRFPYGITKFTAEQYVQYFHESGKLSSFVILRLFYAFGKWERTSRLFRRVIETVVSGTSYFTVGDEGQSILDPLSVGDVARAIELVAFTDACDGEILNLCRGEPYHVRDLVTLIANALGSSIQVNCNHVPERFPVHFWGEPSRIMKLTSFRASTLEDSIRGYAHWITQKIA